MNLGDEVALISKTNEKKKKCYFIGYGIYLGKDIIPYNKLLDKIGKRLSLQCDSLFDKFETNGIISFVLLL